ncbi:hypothetical protein [Candidatus Manganitrophus noduliformans]|uniref:hypothetical protein n=1 Tax=Candidatus Manganitrophus noduliformans TaxID=2606439 RepID=UPI00143C7530|nr:hypothetical protein [Candidatus Manganitrophus noduliformans]
MSENEDAIEILLSRCDEKLTEWEVNFLESIQDHPDQLSKKQQETLDNIWARCMG